MKIVRENIYTLNHKMVKVKSGFSGFFIFVGSDGIPPLAPRLPVQDA